VKLPGPGVSQTDASVIRRVPAGSQAGRASDGKSQVERALATEGDCSCRVRGTIELHPDHLLASRLRVVVMLREAPALRDTVELFMGSPRDFEFPPLRCVTWNLRIEPLSDRSFEVVSTDGKGPIDCTRGGLRQLRIVVDPR
jgi:hypothetical protein